jgi:SAM-dependent methyltransferase
MKRNVEVATRALPDRYLSDWREPFDRAAAASLVPGCRVLDIGSGRLPAIPPSRRPTGCHYVGLDLSLRELQLADAAAYDETIVADVCNYQAALEGTFDLIVSWQVLEHVPDLALALENARRYLRPGGVLVAQFSGRYSLFGFPNRLLPHRLARLALKVVLSRDADTVFPAYYEGCYYDAILSKTRAWSKVRVISRFRGGVCLGFIPPVRGLYLKLEDSMIRGRHRNLATHYLLICGR